jgi:hypothetical protein
MAKQTINIGAVPNDGTGSNLRTGGTIINDNFTELYNALGSAGTITLTATPTELNQLSGATVVTSTGSATLTNKTLNLSSNTLTGTTAQFNTALSDGDFATLDNTVALTNKTISGASNTLSNIGNSSLTNSSFSIRDDSSSAISIALGGTLKLKSNDGITTTVSQGDTITISLDSNILTETSTDTLTNKSISLATNTITGTIAQFNTAVSDADLSTTAGVETLTNKTISGSSNTLSNIGNASLTNSSITLGSTSTSLGGTTSSVAGLSLTGSGTIDLTGSGNKLRFNFANTGAFPSATTYQGQFAIATGAAKAYFADSGSYNEILSENSSIKDLSDVGPTNPTNGQILIFNSSTGRYEPGAQSGGSATLVVGDNTSTTGTINLATQTLGFVGTNGITTTVNGGNSTIETRLTDDFYADNYLPASAVFDVTHGGGYYFFNSHYSGNSPTLYLKSGHTYAFKLNVAGHPFHLQTIPNPSGIYPVSYSAGNPYTTGLVHVSANGTVTTGAVGPQIAGTLYIKVPANSNSKIYYACQNHAYMGNTIVLGSLTDTFTGDGSTVTYSINNGRNVNDILVYVNGVCLVPTSDYTITNTSTYNVATLTFVTAPVSAASIMIRYLG